MVKSGLVGIVKNAVRSIAFVGAMSLALYGCHPDPLEPDNRSPVASLTLSKYSGDVPLDVNISAAASDADGDVDITNYKIVISNKASSSIDTTINSSDAIPSFKRVFKTAGVYDVTFTATDSHGAHDSKSATVNVSDKPPVTFNAPVATFSVDKTSGDSPLPVRFKVNGSDKDNDIVSYRLYLDGKVDSSSVPIDTVMTFFPGNHSVYAEVVDKHKLSNSTSPTSINVSAVASWMNQFPLPKDKINLFIFPDSAVDSYNSLKTKIDRDNYLSVASATDICATIPVSVRNINGVDYGFLCVQHTGLFEFDSNDWENLYDGSVKRYDGYMNDNIDSMFVHHGTGKFRAKHIARVFNASVSPDHTMNYAVTGDNLHPNALNFIESSAGKSNIRLNEFGIPQTYPDFTLYYSYSFVDNNGHNSYGNIPIAKYNLVNGVLNFVETNPNLEVIMTRDTVAPVINVGSPVQGKTYAANSKILLDEVIVGDTYRYGYYSFDGGQTKTAIRKKEHMDLIHNGNRYFTPGNYTLSIYAKNEFYMESNKVVNFTVK